MQIEETNCCQAFFLLNKQDFAQLNEEFFNRRKSTIENTNENLN